MYENHQPHHQQPPRVIDVQREPGVLHKALRWAVGSAAVTSAVLYVPGLVGIDTKGMVKDAIKDAAVDFMFDEKEVISLPPATDLQVARYSAYVTAEATAHYATRSKLDKFKCNYSMEEDHTAIGSVQQLAGTFTMTPDQAAKSVAINVSNPPKLNVGVVLQDENITKLDSGFCSVDDLKTLLVQTNNVSQAAGKGLGDCITASPTFKQVYEGSMKKVAGMVYPGFTPVFNYAAGASPVGDPEDADKLLADAIEKAKDKDVNVEAGKIEHCDIRDIKSDVRITSEKA